MQISIIAYFQFWKLRDLFMPFNPALHSLPTHRIIIKKDTSTAKSGSSDPDIGSVHKPPKTAEVFSLF